MHSGYVSLKADKRSMEFPSAKEWNGATPGERIVMAARLVAEALERYGGDGKSLSSNEMVSLRHLMKALEKAGYKLETSPSEFFWKRRA